MTGRFCVECGAVLRGPAQYCVACGAASLSPAVDPAGGPTARPSSNPPTTPKPTAGQGVKATRRWAPVVAIGALGLMITIGALVSTLSRSNDRKTEEVLPSRPSVTEKMPVTSAAPVQVAEVNATPSCTGCSETGRIDIRHPAWGPTRIVVFGPTGSACTDGGELQAYDQRGSLRWSYVLRNAGCYQAFEPAGVSRYGSSKVPRAVDASGRIFVDYNPGRYNGVIVLVPTPDGFATLNTLPSAGEYSPRFYSGVATDSDGDGTYEIEVTTNDCSPNCAQGAHFRTRYAWLGNDFAAVTAPERIG